MYSLIFPEKRKNGTEYKLEAVMLQYMHMLQMGAGIASV